MKIGHWPIWDRLFHLFLKRSLTILTIVFLTGIIIMMSLMLHYGEAVNRSQALNHVRDTVQFLQSARTLYNDEVISRVNGLEGIQITHAPTGFGSIPLPATFLKDLSGGVEGFKQRQMQFRLYSEYPFPWRSQEGFAQDAFEKEALAVLKQKPDRPFVRFEKQGNLKVLRYAEAEILQPSCVKCHNTYPGTPKTDWQVGDLRGVLSVTQPLALTSYATSRHLRNIFLLMVGISVLGAIGLSWSVQRLKRYSNLLERKVAVRQQTMEQAFTQIHNGPLQTLAIMIQEVQRVDLPKHSLYERLRNLNTEIRSVGHSLMEQAGQADVSEPFTKKKAAHLRLGEGSKVALDCPLHELFYEVFSLTLSRPLPCFSAIRVKVRTFEPLDSALITIELKRELCLWLEEALCNVGKHAQGSSRVVATGTLVENEYVLSVQDNGSGLTSDEMSGGSEQANTLAQRLGGRFKRQSLPQGGTLCELRWSISSSM